MGKAFRFSLFSRGKENVAIFNSVLIFIQDDSHLYSAHKQLSGNTCQSGEKRVFKRFATDFGGRKNHKTN